MMTTASGERTGRLGPVVRDSSKVRWIVTRKAKKR